MEGTTLPAKNVNWREVVADAGLARVMDAEGVFGMSSGELAPANSHTMTTRKALTIATIIMAGATASFLLAPPKSRPAQTVKTYKVEETEDPFADMIEEGDGLLAQRKAEAAEAGLKRRQA